MKDFIKIKFQVMEIDPHRGENLTHTCDSYEEAEKWINDHIHQADLMGTVTYNIRKVYTNLTK